MTITAQAPAKTTLVGPQAIESLSNLYDEPAWMRAARQEARRRNLSPANLLFP